MTTRALPARHNAAYAVVEYLVQPALMLAAAPVLLRGLGATEYGLWMLVNSVSATVAGLGGGFGDATTKFIASCRGQCDRSALNGFLLAAVLLNATMGFALAALLFFVAPLLAAVAFHLDGPPELVMNQALRISAFILLFRFLEVVFSSALRAHELYRPTVFVSSVSRIAGVVIALVAVHLRLGLPPIMTGTAVVGFVALLAHAFLVSALLDARLRPRRSIRTCLSELVSYGIFTWAKSASGVIFAHSDRLITAAFVGPRALGYYVLCTQVAQPINALLAAAFSILFPHLSARIARSDFVGAKRVYKRAALGSLSVIVLMFVAGVVLAKPFLTLWIGAEAARHNSRQLVILLAAYSLFAASIVPHYAALALARVRFLLCVNICSGLVFTVVALVVARPYGTEGIAVAKLLSATVGLVTYGIVWRCLTGGDLVSRHQSYTEQQPIESREQSADVASRIS